MNAETFLNGKVQLHCGDCLEVMASLPENSVDAVVCDPPYHLHSIVKRFAKTGRTESTRTNSGPHQRTATGFMGKQWDGGDIAFNVETWQAVHRVLKPGGYILAFSSSRTFGRMSVAIEDAGFVNHPLIGWIFGQGFPKAHRVHIEGMEGWRYGGQALKPALEPIYMGQKPFSEINGTKNIEKWGTGALNIEACKVFADDMPQDREGEESQDERYTDKGSTNFAAKPGRRYTVKRLKPGATLNKTGGNWRPEEGGVEFHGEMTPGRWPANIMTDGSPEVFAAFPDSDGQQFAVTPNHAPKEGTAVYGDYGARPEVQPRGDKGSAARFFWSSKATAKDRVGSKHPTVKPIDLIEELVTLITPPGGTVLDCFAGTGTTGEAAFRLGFNAVLIEREPEYQADIRRRMALCMSGPEERKRESIKAKLGDVPFEAGSLFAGIEAAE